METNTPFSSLPRLLIVFGITLIAAGLVFLLLERQGLPWRLPGDIVIRRKNWSVWVPITTSVLLSIVLTVLLNLFRRH